MAPKPPPYWDLYRDQMSRFDYGHALWQTIPVADSKRIQPGDVGYVRKGRFHLLFSASLSPVQESDAPQSFEILTVGRIVCDVPVPAGPLKTETAQVIKERVIPIPSPTPASSPPSSSSYVHSAPFNTSDLDSRTTESASCTSFQLRGENGALLLTKYPMYREDVEREGHFKEYTRKHYNSWVEFARQNGHGDGDLNPVLVTGVDRTRDFVMLCYSKDNDRVINCEFTTPIPGVNDYGKWNFPDEFVHTNHSPQTLRGPLPTQATDPTSSGDNDPETISDQHVFIRYFTVRKRLWVPMVIKASAGPHELGGGGYEYDDDGSPLEVPCGSDQGPDLLYTPSNLSDGDGSSSASIDTECDSVVHNIRAGGRDDFDVIADYVFQNSNAESVLLHHKDVALLRKLGDGTDLSTLMFEGRLRIVVDTDGVGTIESQTDLPAETWDGGVMTPTISSAPSDNRQQATNLMALLEPQPSSHYQQNILGSAQEPITDANSSVSKSIASVFGDRRPDWPPTGPQLSSSSTRSTSGPPPTHTPPVVEPVKQRLKIIHPEVKDPALDEPGSSEESRWRTAYEAARMAIDMSDAYSDMLLPLKAVVGALSVLNKNFDQTADNADRIKETEERVDSLGEILASPVGDQDDEEKARRGALRKNLDDMIAKLRPPPGKRGIVEFLKNATHAETLNTVVEDLATAVTDYQTSIQQDICGDTKKIGEDTALANTPRLVRRIFPWSETKDYHFTMPSLFSRFPSLSRSSNPPSPPMSLPEPCINCHSKLQARDQTTGGYYRYCSKACATAISQKSSSPNPAKCDHCKIRPRYTDGGVVLPYCGKRCADLAKGKRPESGNAPSTTSLPPLSRSITTNTDETTPGASPNVLRFNGSGFANPPRNSIILNNWTPRHNRASVQQPDTLIPFCWVPECFNRVYVGKNGATGHYCSKAHMKLGTYGCICCRKAPVIDPISFCQSCGDEVFYMAPLIVEVPTDHERYTSVASQFKKKWQHNNNCPEVRAIYKIVSTIESLENFEQYLNLVEAKGNFIAQGKTRGNENRRWHGTTRNCNIGDKGETDFCQDSSCSLCSIMKSSFDLSFSMGTGMFGGGIYTSSTTSKSDHFSRNVRASEWKAMLLNKVVVGKGYRMTAGDTTLVGPPDGYDSVLAEASDSGLNYDELVVYDNDAIRPSYLVMYDVPK